MNLTKQVSAADFLSVIEVWGRRIRIFRGAVTHNQKSGVWFRGERHAVKMAGVGRIASERITNSRFFGSSSQIRHESPRLCEVREIGELFKVSFGQSIPK
jgi:hypothetical protein